MEFLGGLPVLHGVFKDLGEFLFSHRFGREFDDAVLGKGALNQMRDIIPGETYGAEAVGDIEALHIIDDLFSEYLAGIFQFGMRYVRAQGLSGCPVWLARILCISSLIFKISLAWISISVACPWTPPRGW